MHLIHFYLWLFDVRYMVKDHTDNERKAAAMLFE